VCIERVGLHKAMGTDITRVGLDARVDAFVANYVRQVTERFAASATHVRLLLGMRPAKKEKSSLDSN
jgi:hypothetical protein